MKPENREDGAETHLEANVIEAVWMKIRIRKAVAANVFKVKIFPASSSQAIE